MGWYHNPGSLTPLSPRQQSGLICGPLLDWVGFLPQLLQPCAGQGLPENCYFFSADHPGHRPAPRATQGSRGPPKTTSPSVVRAGILNPGGLWIEFKVWMGRKQTTFIASPLWLQGGDSYTLENGKPEGSIAAAAMTSAETGHVSLPHVPLGHSETSGTYIFTGGSS